MQRSPGQSHENFLLLVPLRSTLGPTGYLMFLPEGDARIAQGGAERNPEKHGTRSHSPWRGDANNHTIAVEAPVVQRKKNGIEVCCPQCRQIVQICFATLTTPMSFAHIALAAR